jgi:nitroreductase
MGAEFFEVVRRQRACRSFDGRPVDDDTLATVLDAGRWGPSAQNAQPWVWVVVQGQGRRAALADVTKRLWLATRSYTRDALAPEVFRDVDEGLTTGLASAPVWIVVAGDERRAPPASMASSVYPSLQNLLLAATAVGLGSVLTTIAAVADTDEIRRICDLPEHVVPLALVPLGWPDHPLGPPRRQPLSACTHAERYGEPWSPDA